MMKSQNEICLKWDLNVCVILVFKERDSFFFHSFMQTYVQYTFAGTCYLPATLLSSENTEMNKTYPLFHKNL